MRGSEKGEGEAEFLRWDAVALLHRAVDGRIATYYQDGKLRPLASVPTRHLHSHFAYPGSVQDPNETAYSFDLRTDGYFSINSMACHRDEFGKLQCDLLPTRNYFSHQVARKKKYVRYLNACYVDIDCYSAGVSTGQVTGQVDDLVIAGKLPQPTIRVYSGRGVWYLWLLYDDEPKTEINPDWHKWPDGWRRLYDPEHYPPIRAWPERVERWEAVQRAIFERLQALGADKAVTTDSARIMRFPGSWNSKADRPVVFQEVGVRDGHVIVYSLAELEEALGVRPPVRRTARKRDEPRDEEAAARCRRLHTLRLEQFQALLGLRRGGFSKGARRNGAFFYAFHLRAAGTAPNEILQRVTAYGASCSPKLDAEECRTKVREALEGRWLWTNERIMRELRISRPEQLALAEQFGPNAWVVPELRPGRNQSATLRREAIKEIVGQRGRLSLRKMVAALADRGIESTAPTVSADYNSLRI